MNTQEKRLLKAMGEARAIARGEMEPARIFVPENVDVKAIRTELKMTQARFSNTFGFPLPTLRDWEQGKSRPDTSARAYLLVISREPQAVMGALHRDVAMAESKPPRKSQARSFTHRSSGNQQAPARRRA
jgi:putative transcriptional regulator